MVESDDRFRVLLMRRADALEQATIGDDLEYRRQLRKLATSILILCKIQARWIENEYQRIRDARSGIERKRRKWGDFLFHEEEYRSLGSQLSIVREMRVAAGGQLLILSEELERAHVHLSPREWQAALTISLRDWNVEMKREPQHDLLTILSVANLGDPALVQQVQAAIVRQLLSASKQKRQQIRRKLQSIIPGLPT